MSLENSDIAKKSVAHIVNPDDSNTTIDKAISLIDYPANKPNAIKAKAVGLQLTLLGVAEVQALRIKNLVIAAYKLEQELYSPEKIEQMEPRKLLATYEALNGVLADAVSYIKSVSSSFDWKELQDNLTTLANELDNVTEDRDEESKRMSEVASELLAGLGSIEKSD
ncbi:hypothetical protein [Vibrio phage Va2]|nr:hypothetical protein [Vibrio phage Va2]